MLEEIMRKKQLVKDIAKLSPVHQTYSLEVFHNVVNHFAPKQQHFFFGAMESRMCLAALHFNENSHLEQRRTLQGDLQWAVCFPKSKKGKAAVVKPVKQNPTYGYVGKLKAGVQRRRMRLTSYTAAGREARVRDPGFLTNQYDQVSKMELIARHRSRFPQQ